LLEEGAHEKSPKCLDGNLGDFGDFAKVSAFSGELAVGTVGGACFGRIGGKRGTIEVFEQGGAVEGFRFHGFCLSGGFQTAFEAV